ncbi:16S rRNA (cytosine(967)-C(5))-methyltransferase RsmB [Mycoplasmatota bacterium]|nr:16S rRNA (cytosine(967)-C(5))-methyltransferase RsmB [Mycoplasmatota bacterium]
MKVRSLAHQTLNRIFTSKEYSNITINNVLSNNELNDKDKRLYTQIVYGVLKNKILLDHYLKPYLKGKSLKDWMRHLLEMSIYQMIFLDRIPKYAILNDAVEVAKKIDFNSSKLINAVLRNFDTENLNEPLKEEIRYSIDEWLFKQIKGQYKEEYMDILDSFNKNPKASARVNSLKTQRYKLLNDRIHESKVTNTGIIFDSGNISHTNAYKKGLVTIQDEASQLVARMLNPKKTDRVLDVCAAPGGKTTHIAEIMKNQGQILANDIHAHKIELIKQNATRLELTNIEYSNHDGTKLRKIYTREYFDKILIDAPCSGWGVIGRKPELKYNQNEKKVEEIRKIQSDLLESNAPLLKVDGFLVYSTCTINKGENEVQIRKFLEENNNFTLEKERMILPHENHTDGFYIAKLKKVTR